MHLREIFKIEEIDYKTAMDIVVKNHYLHRRAPCSFAFGLFEISTNNLKGVITYGTPPSPSLRAGICGPEESGNVIELTRLWTCDTTPKNSESFLIGNTIKLVDKEIIVSFAEIEQGHVGTVYQATNWVYCGLTAKRTDWKVEGLDRHSITLADKYTAKEIREIYGNRFSLVPRPRKHRYIYFNADRKRRKELLNKLKYPISTYPKHN